MALAAASLASARAEADEAAPTLTLETYGPSMRYDGAPAPVLHTPLAHAAQKWRLCAVLPHVKDPYWLDVVYGMTKEARRLGVALRIIETGGYLGKSQQIAALADCGRGGADAAIFGSVGYGDAELVEAIAALARRTPVIGAVNDVDAPALSAKVGVSWRRMGEEVGAFLARRHPEGSPPATAVLATGPRAAGWTGILESGLRAGLARSSVKLIDVEGADTDTFEQYRLVERLLERHPDVDYLIGAAPAIESAKAIFAQTPRARRPALIATYFTSTLRRGLRQGAILAAPYDWPHVQGELAVEYATRAIEHRLDHRQIGPRVTLLRPDAFPRDAEFAPSDFEPTFDIK